MTLVGNNDCGTCDTVTRPGPGPRLWPVLTGWTDSPHTGHGRDSTITTTQPAAPPPPYPPRTGPKQKYIQAKFEHQFFCILFLKVEAANWRVQNIYPRLQNDKPQKAENQALCLEAV